MHQTTPVARSSRILAAGVLLAALLASLWLFSGQGGLQIGYLVVESEDGSPVPVGTALFSFRNADGILVSEAGVGAAQTLSRGRIFVDQRGTDTGLAMANPSDETVEIELVLRDSDGAERGRRFLSLEANQHLARNVNQPDLFPTVGSGFTGSLTFEVQDGREIAAVTVRQSTNRQNEPLLATLPVIDVSGQAAAGAAADTLVFPHLGGGTQGGITLSTEIILVNPTAAAISGNLRLVDTAGQPLPLRRDGGVNVTEFDYDLAANGTFTAELSSSAASTLQGYAVVTPTGGSSLPSGTAIFRFQRGNDPVSEAGVAAIPATTRARIFVDFQGAADQTGFALAVPGQQAATIELRLLDRNGIPLEGREAELQLVAGGQTARFAGGLGGIFEDLENGFNGILEISSQREFVPITLKFTINGRGDFVLTTLPVADLNRLPQATRVVFPQIGLGPILGGEFTTRLIFVNGDLDTGLAGSLTFFRSFPDDGELLVSHPGAAGNVLPYAVPGGAAGQYFPGAGLDLASIELGASEVQIVEGQSLQLSPVARDTAGNIRDDFVFQYGSLDAATIAVDQFGRLTALNRGFANVTVQARSIVESLVVTGITLTQAAGNAFQVVGLQGEGAGRIYLSTPHQVLLSEQITAEPQRFAGSETPGFRNDPAQRLDARFREPTFVALDRGRNRLYLSDSGNSAIRAVSLGDGGPVTTLVGTGLQNPQGLVLDQRGRLWVADRDAHLIRIVDLGSTPVTVTTLAGSGQMGSQDGQGTNASFSCPTGLALEGIPLEDLLAADDLTVSVLAVDACSGRLRRVYEDGTVETVTPATIAPMHGSAAARRRPAGNAPFLFEEPSGIVVDDLGNVYVSEPGTGRVRLLLRTGRIVEAIPPGVLGAPRQLDIVTQGRILVGESSRSVSEIRYAGPSIAQVQPDRIGNQGGERITVRGNNFATDIDVLLDGRPVDRLVRVDSRTLRFTAPALPSGRVVLTLRHRGGLDQAEVLVDATPLEQLNRGEVTTIAGGTDNAGNGRFATESRFVQPFRAVSDEAGNLFVADPGDHRVRRIDAETRIMTTVTGTGRPGFFGDGGPARLAAVSLPTGLAVGPAGELLIVDAGNNALRRVDPDTGFITTLVRNPLTLIPGFAGPSQIWDVAVGENCEIYLLDRLASLVVRFDPAERTVEPIAGTGTAGFNGDGTATAAQLGFPQGIGLDRDGNLLIADTSNHLIRRVNIQTGQLVTLAGVPGQFGFGGDNGPPEGAVLTFPADVFGDASGRVWLTDSGNHRVRGIAANRIQTLAGNGTAGFSGDGGAPTAARLNVPTSVLVNAENQVFVVELGNQRVRSFGLAQQVISTYAGSDADILGDGGPATGAALSFPAGLAFDSNRNLYIADSNHHRIRKVRPPQGLAAFSALVPQGSGLSTLEIETVAGTGIPGYEGDGGLPGEARLNSPLDIELDGQDNCYVSDTSNHAIRLVTAQSPASLLLLSTTAGSGVISTLAGTGVRGFRGDGGPAVEARLDSPVGSTLDGAGNFYFTDTLNNRVRRVDPNGRILTLVGAQGELNTPQDVLFDGESALFIADTGSHRVLRFDLNTGGLERFAGTGQAGFSGDGGAATRARLDQPSALALSSTGVLYIADSGNGLVRRVGTNGTIGTAAGTGEFGFGGDNRPAVEATFNSIAGIALDADDNLYVCDSNNHRIRAVRGPNP